MHNKPADRQAQASEIGDDNRFDILVEKSLHGALSDAERAELGAEIERRPELAAALRDAQSQMTETSRLIQRAAARFDPDIARRAIEREQHHMRRALVGGAAMVVALPAIFIGHAVIKNGSDDLSWLYSGTIALLMVCFGLIPIIRMHQRTRSLVRMASESEEGLRLAYQTQAENLDKQVRTGRIIAVCMTATMALLLIENIRTGDNPWFAGIALLGGLVMCYCAFMPGYSQRLKAWRMGIHSARSERKSNDRA